MLPLLLGALSCCGVFWKTLPTLLWPVTRSWLSKGLSFGFVHLVSLYRSNLTQKALDTITKSLRASVPFAVSEVYFERVSVSIGFAVGLRIRATGVRLVLDSTSADVWPGAVDDTRATEAAKGAAEAAAKLAVVNKELQHKRPSWFKAKLIEGLASRVHVNADDVHVIIRTKAKDAASVVPGLRQSTVEFTASVYLVTSKTWAIETGGTCLRAQACFSARAGEDALQDILRPTRLQVNVVLPRLIRTLSSPEPLANKRVKLEADLRSAVPREGQGVAVIVSPIAVGALARLAEHMGRFALWRASIADSALGDIAPVASGERASYLAALAKGNDVRSIEKVMPAEDILSAHCDAERWPIPPDLTRDEWLAELQAKQKAVRSLQASLHADVISLEALTAGEDIGQGCTFLARNVHVRAQVDASPIAGAQSTVPSYATDEALISSLEVEASVESVEVHCEPIGTPLAAPVLESCAISVRAAKRSFIDNDNISFQLGLTSCEATTPSTSASPRRHGGGGRSGEAPIVATISSRALWRAQQAAAALKASLPTEVQDEDGEPRAVSSSTPKPQRQALAADVERFFARLDHDDDNLIDIDEVRALIDTLYARYMTEAELSKAAAQLFKALDADGSGTVSVEELRDFFGRSQSRSCRQPVCLELGEFRRPVEFPVVRKGRRLDVLELFDSEVRCDEPAEVLQLRWVRTVENYEEARRTWQETIRPTLDQKYGQWRLFPELLAVDFWSDTAIAMQRRIWTVESRAREINLRVQIAGLSMRLADNQHVSASPRVRFDLDGFQVEGGIRELADGAPLQFCGLSGNLNLHADYWNQRRMHLEPFVESWRLCLCADDHSLEVHAEQHLAINITPPLLHALSVAANSLRSSNAASDARRTASTGKSSAAVVLVQVRNCTHSGIIVRARSPVGESQPRIIEAGSDERFIELEVEEQREGWFGGLSRRRPAQTSDHWVVSLGGVCTSGNPTWALPEDINFSVTGRYIVSTSVGQKLAIDVFVDVRSLAPVVTVSGITATLNLTDEAIAVRRAGNVTQYSTVGPGDLLLGNLGGGAVAVHFPADAGSSSGALDSSRSPDLRLRRGGPIPVPFDADDLACTEQDLGLLEGRRFVLLDGGPSEYRTLVCVPALRVLNALPYFDIKCRIWNLQPGSADDLTSLEQGIEDSVAWDSHDVPSGQVRGFTGVDDTHPVVIAVELGGYQYFAIIPEGTIFAETTIQRARIRKKGKVKHNVGAIGELKTKNDGAPFLDVELDWHGYCARVTIYARYLVQNKSGWSIEVSSKQSYAGGLRSVEETQRPGCFGCDPMCFGTQPEEAERERQRPMERTVAGLRATERPEFALMRVQTDEIRLRVRGGLTKNRWSWDEQADGTSLTHWPRGFSRRASSDGAGDTSASVGAADASAASEERLLTNWSQGISIALSDATGVANLPHESVLGLNGVFTSTLFGVQIQDMPAPFERSKMVTVAPRYIIMNQLDEPVQLWLSFGTKRRAPVCRQGQDSATGETDHHLVWARHTFRGNEEQVKPTVAPHGCCVAIDEMPPILGHPLPNQVPMISARLRRDSPEGQEEGEWSTHIPLLTVGEMSLALHGDQTEEPRAVLASVQLVGATMWVVLSKGHWPFRIENRSLQHTLVFYQDGARDLKEWTVKPRESLQFAMPDPDLPKHLIGRIRGAGSSYAVRYELDDASKRDQAPMFIPGRSRGHGGPSIESSLELEGLVRILRFKDGHPSTQSSPASRSIPAASAKSISRRRTFRTEKARSMADRPSTFASLGMSLSLPGLHVSIVDTDTAVGLPPRELLALTVDYVRLEKRRHVRDVNFFVHNLQVDDFASSNQFLLGPMASGLNSQRDTLADSKHFRARSWLHVKLKGPQDARIPFFDSVTSVLTLTSAELLMKPLELQLDVPRLIRVADQLAGWTRVLNGAQQPKAKPAPVKQLTPGLRKPRLGPDTTLCIAEFLLSDLSVRADVRLRPRASDDVGPNAEDAEVAAAGLEVRLRSATANLWTPIRVLVDTVLRLGASVAEVSPRFTFGKILIPHVNSGAGPVVTSLSKHYQQQALAQTVRLLGSVQLLGDPANLLDELGSSVVGFVKKTEQEVSGERDTVGEGLKDLTGGVVGGVFGSMAKISGSLKGAINGVTGVPLVTDRRAMNVKEGLDLGLTSFANGFSYGVSEFIEDPWDAAWEDGAAGFIYASAHGTLGLVARPVEGTLGAVEKITQGVEGQARGDARSYYGFRRPPRVDFGGDERNVGLSALDQSFFWPAWRLKVLKLSLPALWWERQVQEISISLAGESDPAPWSEIVITRARAPDTWALRENLEENLAVGRVGQLRGPFRLRVDALVESNIEMTEPFRVTVGFGSLPSERLFRALRAEAGVVEQFQVVAEPSVLMEDLLREQAFGSDAATLGNVSVELAPDFDQKILPYWILGDDTGEVEPLDVSGPPDGQA